MTLEPKEQELLLHTRLFAGVSPSGLEPLLNTLHAQRKYYDTGAYVVHEGDLVSEVGVVLSGHARSLNTDESGEPLIISLVEAGSFIGVLLAASRERRSPVSVQAQEPLEVLFLPAERLIHPETAEQDILLRNFLDSVAEQSLTLNDRISCLIRHSVREKVATYLTRLAREKNAREFSIPMDRNAMSNYLNVERSALSRELSRMRADGLIEYRKNHFRLLDL